jgi:hypothetical protein
MICPTLRRLSRLILLFALCLGAGGEAVDSAAGATGAAPATTWITYVDSSAGRIAVHVSEPQAPRYADGAPVVVNVSGFFTPRRGFAFELDPNALGALYITYLWPGTTDPHTDAASTGTFDFGGPKCLAALRDVIRFATGDAADAYGKRLHESARGPVSYGVVGLYAFSHSGIAATNVLALHGADLAGVRFFVGRENPTVDPLYPLEPGHWDDAGAPVDNPFYDPTGYTPTSIAIDYSTVYWSERDERPAFRVEGGTDYVCSAKHPQIDGKDVWSTALLQALLDNGALTRETWPATLATPEEAKAWWDYRTTVSNYPRLADALPNLKVMLVFAAEDHVQTAVDKPHVHQAYDGFHERAGLWCRLNPDRAYVEAFLAHAENPPLPDNPANQEPASWLDIRAWAYPARQWPQLNVLVPLAAVAEMCDRTRAGVWLDDVSAPLF